LRLAALALAVVTGELSAVGVQGAATAEIGPGPWLVFSSQDCPDCQLLKNEFFPALARKRPSAQLPPTTYISLDEVEGYERLMDVEKRLGVTGEEFPALLIGERLLYGMTSIKAYFGQVDDRPAQADIHPSPAKSVAKGEPPRPAYATAQILYFETTGCRQCARVEKQIGYLRQIFPNLRIAHINSMNTPGRLLQLAAAKHLQLPAADRLTTPMVMSADSALYGPALSDAKLILLFEKAGMPRPFWQSWDEAAEFATAEKEMRVLAGRFTLPGMIVAGLVDGINPCAFAVILFLVSYLTLAGNRPGGNTADRSVPAAQRHQALFSGLAFSAGVYICYFLIGLGLFQMLDALQGWRGVPRIMFNLMGGVCLLFALAAAMDVINAHRKGTKGMKFGMPKSLRGVVHRLIRERAGRNMLLIGAFGLGFVVSALELVCTGQIYLPVLIFINRTSAGIRSVSCLAIYNLAFILPLLAVVVLGVYGLGSRRLSQWAEKNAIFTRALAGIVVFVLALAMFHFGN
jgi:cytochrome c biogenesis protein CcdA/glutaredoxin